MTLINTTDHQQCDCQSCRMRMLGDTGLVECLMEIIRCQWAVSFEDKYLCVHPFRNKFVSANQPKKVFEVP